MKKILALSMASVLTIMLCGCEKAKSPSLTDNQISITESGYAETSSLADSQISFNESESKTDSSVSEAVTEDIADFSNNTTSQFITASSEMTETSDSYEEYAADFPVGIDMSQYNGKFYQWKFDRDIVTDNEEDFKGGKDVISSAKAVAEDYFKPLVMSSKIVTEEDYPPYRKIGFECGHWNWQYTLHEEHLDETLKLYFSQGVYDDFDNDGKRESFIIFSNENPWGLPIDFAVFVDGSGNAQVLTESIGIFSSDLYPIRYNGFMHLIVNCGYNNSTNHAEFYAVEEGKAIHKHKEWGVNEPFVEPYKDVFMKTLAIQRSGSWLVFWNEELNEYCTLAGDEITDTEAEELFIFYSNEEKKDSDEYYKKYDSPKKLQVNTRKIDNIYCVESNYDILRTYEYKGGKFQNTETRLMPGEEMYTEVFVSGIDFNNIEDKIVKLPN